MKENKQGDLFELRDQCMAQVAENAEEHCEDFANRASNFVVSFLRHNGATAGEKITNACKDAGIVPHDDRAFGPVYMGLAKRGMIVKVGTCQRKKGHLTAGGNIWDLK